MDLSSLTPVQWAGVAAAAVGGVVVLRGRISGLFPSRTAGPSVDDALTLLRHLASERREPVERAKCFEALDCLDLLASSDE